MLKDYECEIEWNDELYTVEADLWDDGDYNLLPASDSGPIEIEILGEPSFCEYEVYHCDTGEVVYHPDSDLMCKAKEVLNNIYWDRMCL